MSQKFVAVRYIGVKESKPDNVLRRPNLVWNGRGDVRFVPLEDAMVYCSFRDIWEIARDVELPADGLPFDTAVSSRALDVVPKPGPEPETAAEFEPQDRYNDEERAARVQETIRAISKLKPEKDFMKDGRPKTASLSEVLGRTVYAEERDAAWEALTSILSAQTAALDSQPE